MSRVATVCVVVMLLLAGCSSAPTGGNGNGGDGENIVTYSNETENSSVLVTVNHDTESYNMRLNGTIEPPYNNFTRNYTIGLYCEVLNATAYNESATQMDLAQNVTYEKTAAGSTETVNGLPERIFTDYEVKTLQATTLAENGTVLDTCTVTGEGEFDHGS